VLKLTQKSGAKMKNTIHATKMQGLGNDFVIVDFDEFERSNMAMSDFAIKICNRNFGIGADGLIIPNLEPKSGDIGWFFYNSDGTTAQMCGNGIRCFAKYCFDKKLIEKKKFDIETLAGIITPEIMPDGNVKVNMSKPILEPKNIPVAIPSPIVEEDKISTQETRVKPSSKGFYLNQKLKIENKTYIINAVSMGNPHCVIFTENTDLLKLAKEDGPKIEKHELFPEGANVEFVRILSKNEIDFCVYERGCGITLACGTGACAAVVSAILNNLTEHKVKVNLLGGALIIEWQGNSDDLNHNVFMTGPAEYSFFADYIF
jgi:diaminopimelate epimerase